MVFLYSETGSSPKIPSPSTSAATKGEQKPSLGNDKTPKLKEALDEAKPVVSPQKVIEKEMSAEVAADVSSMKHKNVILFIVLFFSSSMVCIYYFARRRQVGKRISIWQDNASLLLLLPFHVFVLLFFYFLFSKKEERAAILLKLVSNSNIQKCSDALQPQLQLLPIKVE